MFGGMEVFKRMQRGVSKEEVDGDVWKEVWRSS